MQGINSVADRNTGIYSEIRVLRLSGEPVRGSHNDLGGLPRKQFFFAFPHKGSKIKKLACRISFVPGTTAASCLPSIAFKKVSAIAHKGMAIVKGPHTRKFPPVDIGKQHGKI